MNASIKTIKRSLAAGVTARRVANWGVLVVALGQTACDEDPDPWAIADGGVDASVTTDAGGEPTTTRDSGNETTGIPTDEISLGLSSSEVVTSEAGDASTTEPSEADASVSSSEPATTGVTLTSETIATSSEVTAPETSAANSSEANTGTSETEASAATAGETSSSVETSSELPVEPTDGGVPDAAAPALEVCGAVIDDAQGISLAQALENYSAPVAEADAGDGGAATDCYPPCIAALLNSCSVKESTCSITDGYSAACWNNGVSQTQVYDYYSDPDAMIVTENAYNGSAPCVSGVMRLDWVSFIATYVWRDGTGAEVATGTDASEELVVTCTDTEQSYTVDKYSCPWLGQIVYNQTECAYPNSAVK